MKKLILMRGHSGSGKTHLLKAMGVEDYVLSPDSLRMMYGSPIYKAAKGSVAINHKNNTLVKTNMFSILEHRMSNGETTVIDDTHTDVNHIHQYKDLVLRYNYEVYVVEMPTIFPDKAHPPHPKYLEKPSEVVEKQINQMLVKKMPSWVTEVVPAIKIAKVLNPVVKDLSNYNAIVHVGDIHGCYSELKQFLFDCGHPNENPDRFYIFTGDLVDRGPSNAEVINTFISLSKLENVLFLKGNHEEWLERYVEGRKIHSREFLENTAPQLKEAVNKEELKRALSTLRPNLYYLYKNETKVIVSHGGINNLNRPTELLPEHVFVRGAGGYSFDVDAAFNAEETDNKLFQVHGHRNIKNLPIINGRSMNLEGRVEFGGQLRAAILTECGWSTWESTPRKRELQDDKSRERAEVKNLIKALRSNPQLVKERAFGDVSSFNFTKKAWFKKEWNGVTIKARGLFLNTITNKVVARAYDKFFNVGEVEQTSIESLTSRLVYPVTWFHKYNGFLGIVGYNDATDSLWVSSKSSIQNDYTAWFRTLLEDALGPRLRDLETLCRHGHCFTFEVIDIINDPHIEPYGASHIVLLDGFKRSIEEQTISYEELCGIGKSLQVPVKTIAKVSHNQESFKMHYEECLASDEQVEGFVIQDRNHFRTKIKMPWYNLWKRRRTISEAIAAGKSDKALDKLIKTKEDAAFTDWLIHTEHLIGKDIITIMKAYNKHTKGV